MHFAFLIYSCYSLCGKIASSEPFLSKKFILLYCGVLLIMFVYAILWQQILKKIQLSVASANKSITIIWGIVFGKLFFHEQITINMILGALFILTGIIIINTKSLDKLNYEID